MQIRTDEHQNERFLTIPEASKRFGIGRRQLVAAIDRDELAAFQIGGWRRVSGHDVVAWVRSQQVRPSSLTHMRVAAVLENEANRQLGEEPGQ